MSKFSICAGLACLFLVSGAAGLGVSASLIEDDSSYYDQRCVVGAKFYEGPDNDLELCRKDKVYLTDKIWFSPNLLGVRDVINSVRTIFTEPSRPDPVIQAVEVQAQGGGDAEPEENPDDEVLLWSDNKWEVYKAEKSDLCYAQSGAVVLSFPMPGSLIADKDPSIAIYVPPVKSEKLGLKDGANPLLYFRLEGGLSNEFKFIYGSVSVTASNTVVTVAVPQANDGLVAMVEMSAPLAFFFSTEHDVTTEISPDRNPDALSFLYRHSATGQEAGDGLMAKSMLFRCIKELLDG